MVGNGSSASGSWLGSVIRVLFVVVVVGGGDRTLFALLVAVNHALCRLLCYSVGGCFVLVFVVVAAY